MPVLGMMSVFDWSEVDNVKNGWTGREWFVVNKARFVFIGQLHAVFEPFCFGFVAILCKTC